MDSESESMDSENSISSGRSSESVLILGNNILHLRSRGEIGTPSPNAAPTRNAYGDISSEIEDTSSFAFGYGSRRLHLHIEAYRSRSAAAADDADGKLF